MNRRRLAQMAAILTTFVIAGPVIGLLVAAPASGLAIAGGGDIGGGTAFAAFMLLYGWLFAHLIGIVPAAIAGSIVTAYAYRRGRVPLAVGALAGLASMGLMVLRHGVITPAWRDSSMVAVVVIWLVTHVAASMACTRLSRRWQ